MRTAKYDSPEEQEFRRKLEEANGDFDATAYGFCESNQNQLYDGLEEMDRLLKRHNLQVVIIDEGSTDCVFKIEKNEKKKWGCKYPKCHYYDPKSKVYCCAGCSDDHYDYDRLHKEERRAKNKLVHLVINIMTNIINRRNKERDKNV